MADDAHRDGSADDRHRGGLDDGNGDGVGDDSGPGDGRRGSRESTSAPLEGLAAHIRARRGDPSAGTGTTPAESPGTAAAAGWGLEAYFEAEPYEAVDSDELWESLEDDTWTRREAEPGTGPNEHVVLKRSYCESCEHFSEPPAVDCTHPGTTLVEFADMEHVTVRNCPVVAERLAADESMDDGPVTPGTFGRQ